MFVERLVSVPTSIARSGHAGVLEVDAPEIVMSRRCTEFEMAWIGGCVFLCILQ